MRVELATPELLVEVYEIDAPAGASDAYVIAACRPLPPAWAERRRQGEPFVMSRDLEDLDAIADALAAWRQAMDAARDFVCTPASEAVSEYELARRLGVDRGTIRRWRSKGQTA